MCLIHGRAIHNNGTYCLPAWLPVFRVGLVGGEITHSFPNAGSPTPPGNRSNAEDKLRILQDMIISGPLETPPPTGCAFYITDISCFYFSACVGFSYFCSPGIKARFCRKWRVKAYCLSCECDFMTQADNFKIISIELHWGCVWEGGILPPHNWISKYLLIFFFLIIATLSL